jgi:uncharacterized protein
MSVQEAPRQDSRSLIVYVALANGLTWLCWIPALIVADRRDYLLPTTANFARLLREGFVDRQHAAIAALFSLAVYGPLIAALVAVSLESGRSVLAELFRALTRWRIGGHRYLALATIALTLAFVPFTLAALLGLGDGPGALAAALPTLPLLLLVQLLTSGLGEEPGWRGYLLPALQRRFAGERPIWLLGVLWAVWHYPFTAYSTATAMGTAQATAAVAVGIALALLGQTMSLIGMAYIYAWLYNGTRSLLVAMLFHALTNTAIAAATGGLPYQFTLLVALMPWAIVLILQRRGGGSSFVGPPPDIHSLPAR